MKVIFYIKKANGREKCEFVNATWNRYRQMYVNFAGEPLNENFEGWKRLEIQDDIGIALAPEKNKIVESGIEYFTKEKPCVIKWVYKAKQQKEFSRWWKACSRYMDRETAVKTLLEKEAQEHFMLDCKYKIVEYKR